ncbi:hypothetical protein NWFMUON74_40650 [Nocardia wallacei]|uniref:Uncharacterized protein n=1 Tax=Nocardia wallacei TaxID=480035 RepID=A0A7G1KQ22_9NOCA|nr:hypothetical protein NWFMUON74_40650 [Nocardia wallacei]
MDVGTQAPVRLPGIVITDLTRRRGTRVPAAQPERSAAGYVRYGSSPVGAVVATRLPTALRGY